jgi:hypothetical protein
MPRRITIVRNTALFFKLNDAKVSGMVIPAAVIAILVRAMTGIAAAIIHWNRLLCLFIEYSTAKMEQRRAAVILCGDKPVAPGRTPVNNSPVLKITVNKSASSNILVSLRKPLTSNSVIRPLDVAIPTMSGHKSMMFLCG